MSKMFGIIKHYYDAGLWTERQVWNAVQKGKITEEEYHLIVDGEPEAGSNEPDAQPDEEETPAPAAADEEAAGEAEED